MILAIADGTDSSPRLKQRLDAVTLKRQVVREKLAHTEQRLEKMLAYLDLMERPGSQYERTSDNAKRQLFNLFFSEIYVWSTDVALDVLGERSAINQAFRVAASEQRMEMLENKKPPAIRRGTLLCSTPRRLLSHLV